MNFFRTTDMTDTTDTTIWKPGLKQAKHDTQPEMTAEVKVDYMSPYTTYLLKQNGDALWIS